MTRRMSRLNTYWRMGYLLHLVSLAEILLLAFLIFSWSGNWNEAKIAAIIFLCTCPIYPQLDARSRFQNYKLAKDQIYMFGFQERIVKPFIKSRCQRDAVLQACKELGFEKICAVHFKKSGYRWYHLLPDILIKNPMIIFDRTFIKTTFFAKTYHSRFDYQALNQDRKLPGEQVVSQRVIKKREKITV